MAKQPVVEGARTGEARAERQALRRDLGAALAAVVLLVGVVGVAVGRSGTDASGPSPIPPHSGVAALAPLTPPVPAPVPLPPAPVGVALAPVPVEAALLAPATAQAPDPPAERRTLALVIGIDDYPGTASDLRHAVDDAEDVALALGTLGVPPSDVLALHDGEATGEAIVRGLRWLARTARTQDVAVVFVAGHVRRTGGDGHAVVAADGTLVRDDVVARELVPFAAPTWLVFATCFGGGFDEALTDGRLLTAAAGPDHLAYETSEYERSFLGEHLVRRALLGGAADQPTAQAAVASAQQGLARTHPDQALWEAGDASAPLVLRPEVSVPTT